MNHIITAKDNLTGKTRQFVFTGDLLNEPLVEELRPMTDGEAEIAKGLDEYFAKAESLGSELREEFINHFTNGYSYTRGGQHIYMNVLADWWIEKLVTQRRELAEKVEGLRKEILARPKGLSLAQWRRKKREINGYNLALDEVKSLISK